MSRQYTQAEKLAYYKRLAGRGGARAPARRRRAARAPVRRYRGRNPGSGSVVVSGRGSYRRRRVYRRRSPAQQENSFLGNVGMHAGNALSKFFGFGAYSVKQNVLIQDPVPVVNKTTSGGCTIRHREYIGDIITGAAGTFNLQSFAINPAQEKTFPWLSQIAANYEQYRIEGMLFEFRSMSADALNSTNTALGQVIMATDYNAANPPFQQKSEMENYEFGQSSRPSESQIHPIECARSQTTITELYTRVNALQPNQDIRLYDLGNFQIATNGFQASNVNIGELWVTYQVCFFKSKMFSALGNYNTFAQWGNTLAPPNGMSPDNILGISAGTPGQFSYNSIPVEITSGTGAVISFPQSQLVQTYLVQVNYLGQGTGTTGAISFNYVNCKSNLAAGDNHLPWVAYQVPYETSGQTCNRKMAQTCIQTEAGGVVPYVEFTFDGIIDGSPSAVYITVSQVPNEAWQAAFS